MNFVEPLRPILPLRFGIVAATFVFGALVACQGGGTEASNGSGDEAPTPEQPTATAEPGSDQVPPPPPSAGDGLPQGDDSFAIEVPEGGELPPGLPTEIYQDPPPFEDAHPIWGAWSPTGDLAALRGTWTVVDNVAGQPSTWTVTDDRVEIVRRGSDEVEVRRLEFRSPVTLTVHDEDAGSSSTFSYTRSAAATYIGLGRSARRLSDRVVFYEGSHVLVLQETCTAYRNRFGRWEEADAAFQCEDAPFPRYAPIVEGEDPDWVDLEWYEEAGANEQLASHVIERVEL